MSTSLTYFKPATAIQASSSSSSSSSGKPNPNRTKPVSFSNWWPAPLFGWSSDPNYMDASSSGHRRPESPPDPEATQKGRSGAGAPALPRPRFSLGCFTEEKAKQLRRKTRECSSFHDVMYHSAIASRLASDLSGGSDE